MADGDEGDDNSSGYDLPPPARPVYPKLNYQLSDKATTAPLEYSEFFGEIWSPVAGLEIVSVRITTNPDSSSVVEFLSQRGAAISFSGESLIYADVPSDLLIALSQREDVHRISAVPNQLFEEVVTEGSGIHNASNWNLKGYTGSGVKVGIIDGGFEGFTSLMGSELPSSVIAMCFTIAGSYTSTLADCEAGGKHGTAVAEVIYDLAPDVELYIANVTTDQIDIPLATDWMISQGVQVINMSMGPLNSYGPGDGSYIYIDSPLFAIDLAVSGGAIWINSAGNYAQKAWYGTSFVDYDQDGWIEIAPMPSTMLRNFVERNCISLSAGDYLGANLRWQDDWTGADNDFGLYLYYEFLDSYTFVTGSDNDQLGISGQIPIEEIALNVPVGGRYCFLIRDSTVSNSSTWLQLQLRSSASFELDWYGQNLSLDSSYTVNAPSESANPGMLAVGASDWHSNTELESFSSRGPTVDGRTKPDIVGVDNANSASWGPWQGTSQSSPQVAGLAALVAEKFPNYTPAQIASYLKENALPRGDSTPSYDWGYGLAYLPNLTPDSPTNVAATTTLGTAEAVISWTTPSVDGGEDISQYTVSGSPGNFIATTTPFGSFGKVVTDISANDDTLSSSAVDADGRLIFVGETHNRKITV